MAIFNKKNSVKSKVASKPKTLSYRLASGAALIPVISEKATRLQQIGQYMFSVVGNVTKVEIKKAVESVFGVKVIGVNSVGLPGKIVMRGRSSGQRKARRHLIVRVLPGQSIDLGKSL